MRDPGGFDAQGRLQSAAVLKACQRIGRREAPELVDLTAQHVTQREEHGSRGAEDIKVDGPVQRNLGENRRATGCQAEVEQAKC